MSNHAERLFAGLKRVTGSEITKEDREEVFHGQGLAPLFFLHTLRLREVFFMKFGTAIRDHDRPQFASALSLLALAFADNVLFGFNSPEDLDKQEIPEGENELPLRWKDDAKKRCILRNVTDVTVDGVTEDALTENRFNYFLHAILRNAGYYKGASVHTIHHALRKKVNSRYTEAEVAQILTQKDTKVYGQKYVAHCSSVDPVGAMLKKVAETSHIEYFQGFSQFHERGLPCELPAKEQERVLQNPELLEMDAEIQRLIKNNADHDSINEARVRYRVALTRLRVATLKHYQTEWVQKRRDWKVLTRGKQQPKYFEKTDCIRALSLIMPELGRLAAVMSSEETLPFEQKLLFTRGLMADARPRVVGFLSKASWDLGEATTYMPVFAKNWPGVWENLNQNWNTAMNASIGFMMQVNGSSTVGII
ncbi:hypothetical protein VTN00DRAFT_5412 [Thermoascus crustaceus]|uniref:uncharacterized protein n=1 Tax=Thermoascus crustaceus TaxID=5088 RepID=UPI003742B714